MSRTFIGQESLDWKNFHEVTFPEIAFHIYEERYLILGSVLFKEETNEEPYSLPLN